MAPLTAEMEKVCTEPEQTVVFPEMETGCAGTPDVELTARVSSMLEPQILPAVTEMFPVPVPAVVEMEFVDELPDHPAG